MDNGEKVNGGAWLLGDMRGLRFERVVASLGVTIRLNRARFLRVWQEAESDHPTGLRVEPHDLPLFHLKYNPACCNRGHAHSCSLLRQNLSGIERGCDGFKSFIRSVLAGYTRTVNLSKTTVFERLEKD